MSIYEYDEKKQRKLDHQDGVEEGMELGIELGEIILIQKKIIKGKTLDAIAEDLESTVDEIRPIYDAVQKFPAGTEAEKIYEELLKPE